MKIIELKIKNFRCYREEVILKVDDLTAIIGKNDVGKSSVLAAATGTDWNSLTDEVRKEKKAERKRLLNTLALQSMTAEMLDQRWAIPELRTWFSAIGKWI